MRMRILCLALLLHFVGCHESSLVYDRCTECSSRQLCCQGVCIDQNENNCGQCGHACKPDRKCCSGTCVNLVASNSHCGRCGNACISDQKCNNGVCTGSVDPDSLARLPISFEAVVGDVILRTLAGQYIQWESAFSAACEGNIKAIKRARAAVRRAKVAVILFSDYLKHKRSQKLIRTLDDAEDTLGAVRDWDVIIGHAHSSTNKNSSLHTDEAAIGHGNISFIEHWQSQRAAAFESVLRWLHGRPATKFRTLLYEFLVDLPVKLNETQPTLDVIIQPLLLQRIHAIAELSSAIGDHDLTTYHHLRNFGVKRCRFALEFLSPALPLGTVTPLIKQLSKAQDHLGFLNDAFVAQERLKEWLLTHPDDETAQSYLSVCAATISKYRSKFASDWEHINPDVLQRKLTVLLNTVEGVMVHSTQSHGVESEVYDIRDEPRA